MELLGSTTTVNDTNKRPVSSRAQERWRKWSLRGLGVHFALCVIDLPLAAKVITMPKSGEEAAAHGPRFTNTAINFIVISSISVMMIMTTFRLLVVSGLPFVPLMIGYCYLISHIIAAIGYGATAFYYAIQSCGGDMVCAKDRYYPDQYIDSVVLTALQFVACVASLVWLISGHRKGLISCYRVPTKFAAKRLFSRRREDSTEEAEGSIDGKPELEGSSTMKSAALIGAELDNGQEIAEAAGSPAVTELDGKKQIAEMAASEGEQKAELEGDRQVAELSAEGRELVELPADDNKPKVYQERYR